ncbi:MAG: acyltransferase [Pseudomonadota bacterium]
MAPAHLHYLDGWRGLAIVMLLLGHFFPVPGINLGALGVNLFFVLSGLLMARLLFIQQVPLPVFYRRRMARILPAALAFLLLIVLLRLAWQAPVAYPEVLAAAAFINNYLIGAQGKDMLPIGHFWSLYVEEHSYVVLAFIALAATLGIAVCTAWYGLHYSGAQVHRLWMHTEVAAFGIFASAALVLCIEGRRWPMLAWVALFAGGVALHCWSVPAPVRTLAGVGALALAISLLADAPAALQTAMSVKPLRLLGMCSFSIYLWQQPFYLWSRHHDLALLAGVASFYLVERPLRAWLTLSSAGSPFASLPGASGAAPPAQPGCAADG